MSESAVDYKQRAIENKKKREAARPKYTKQDLQKMIVVLGDRLALALHYMTNHDWWKDAALQPEHMEYLDDMCESLLEIEPPPKSPGRPRRWDNHRNMQRYRYLRAGIRTMLRQQIENPPEVPSD